MYNTVHGHPKAPRRWSIPLHILKEPNAVGEMRSMNTASASASKDSPVNRLFCVMHDTSVFAQQHIKDSPTKHRKQKQALLIKLRQSDLYLEMNRSPSGVDTILDPSIRDHCRCEAQTMREQVEEQLRRPVQAEQDRWARDRSLVEYISEGSCSWAFFENMNKARVYSNIEKMKGGHTITEVSRGRRARFSGGRKNIVYQKAAKQ
jgi:hypothetical protein